MLLLNSKDTGTKSACEPIPGRYPTYLYKLGSWVYFKNHYDGNLLQCGVIRSKFLVCREKNLTWVVCVHVHVLGPEMSPLESIDRSQITHLPKRYHYHHWRKGKETHVSVWRIRIPSIWIRSKRFETATLQHTMNCALSLYKNEAEIQNLLTKKRK